MKCVNCDKEIDKGYDDDNNFIESPTCKDCFDQAVEYYGNHQYDGMDL